MAEDRKKKSLGMRVLSVVHTVIIYLLAVGVLLGAVLFVMDQNPQKTLFGYRYYTVLTNSMQPTLSAGDMVLVKCKDISELQVGDVVTYYPSTGSEVCLTHRVVEITEDYEGTGETCIKTKGDANETEDSFWVDGERIVGTVSLRLPKLGYLVRFVQLRWYFVVPLVILLLILIKLLRMYVKAGEEQKTTQEQEAAT